MFAKSRPAHLIDLVRSSGEMTEAPLVYASTCSVEQSIDCNYLSSRKTMMRSNGLLLNRSSERNFQFLRDGQSLAFRCASEDEISGER